MDYFSSSEYSTSYPLAATSSNNSHTGKDKLIKSGGNGGGGSSRRANNRLAMKLSTDAQSVAARERRHRISERFKILQSLVPGGSKMDTVSMLEEAIHYVKFLKAQIWLHQTMIMTSSMEYGYGATIDHHSFFFLPPPDNIASIPAKSPADHDSYALQFLSNVVGDEARGFAAPLSFQPGFAHFGPDF